MTARSQIDPKFEVVYERGTNGVNYDVTTDRIVEVLTGWDQRFGIEISEVSGDRVLVVFTSLPDDLGALAREIYETCPDVIDQGYGCMDDMVTAAEETGQQIPPELRGLVEGIDFDAEDIGLEILQRDLKAKRRVALWWD